jgi:hypothetical protein
MMQEGVYRFAGSGGEASDFVYHTESFCGMLEVSISRDAHHRWVG